MNLDHAARVKTGIILIISCGLFSSTSFLFKEIYFHLSSTEKSEFAFLNEKRFDELKKALPSRGVVGYISERKPVFKFSGNRIMNVKSLHDFFVTRYALAPIILANTEDCQLVIGNFYGSIPDIEYFNEKNLDLIKDFGNGVMLFKRK